MIDALIRSDLPKLEYLASKKNVPDSFCWSKSLRNRMTHNIDWPWSDQESAVKSGFGACPCCTLEIVSLVCVEDLNFNRLCCGIISCEIWLRLIQRVCEISVWLKQFVNRLLEACEPVPVITEACELQCAHCLCIWNSLWAFATCKRFCTYWNRFVLTWYIGTWA